MYALLVGCGKFSSTSFNKILLSVMDIHLFLPNITVNSNIFYVRVTEMRHLSVSESSYAALKLASLGVICQQLGRKKHLRPQTRVSNCTFKFRIYVYRTNCITVRPCSKQTALYDQTYLQITVSVNRQKNTERKIHCHIHTVTNTEILILAFEDVMLCSGFNRFDVSQECKHITFNGSEFQVFQHSLMFEEKKFYRKVGIC